MVFVSPLLVFTPWTALMLFHAWLTDMSDREIWVENRTPQPIRVAPFMWNGQVGTHRVDHFPNVWRKYSNPPTDHAEIPPGESRRMFVDHWGAIDTNSDVDLAIQSPDGGYRVVERGRESRAVITDLDALPPASARVVEAVSRPPRKSNFGLSVGVIVALGIGSPVAMWRLRRAYRKSAARPTGVEGGPGAEQ